MRANRYVSYLAAEIEPKAISTLNQWERQAVSAMEKIAAAGQRGAAGFGKNALGTAAIRNARDFTTAANQHTTASNKIVVANQRVAASSGLAATSFKRSAQALQIVQGPLGPLAGRLSALGDVMARLTGFSLAGVLAGGGAFALGSIATQYQNVTDKLRPLFETQQDLNRAMDQVVGIAHRTRQALAPVADLYSKIVLGGRAAGMNEERAGRIAELAAKAARISGGAAATQEAGLGQFSQGFGSGTLAGEELKSIKENTLFLAKAIADGLDVPIGKLKELGAEGKLTPEVVAAALERSAIDIDTAFARLPKRIGTSLTELSNNFSIWIGRMDEGAGATGLLAEGISFLANNLNAAATAAGLLAAAFVSSGFASAAKGMTAFAASIGTSIANSRALTAAMREGNAVILGSAQAAAMRASHIAQSAKIEREAAAAAVGSGNLYKAQLISQIALIEKQIVAQRKAVETARLMDTASRAQGGVGNAALVRKATEELNAALRARALTQQQLVGVDLELAAADARLAAAGTALTGALAAESAALTAATAATGRFATAKLVLQAAITKVTGAAASLVGFLGGPWGVAFMGAAAIALILAGNVNAAAQAAREFEGDQESLAAKLGFTTNELYKQSTAARQLAIDLARVRLMKSKEEFEDINRSGARVLGNAAIFQGASGNMSRQDAVMLQRLRGILLSGQSLSGRGKAELRGVISRNENLREDPELLQTLIGLEVGNRKLKDAIDDANEVGRQLAVPRKPPPNLSGSGKPETQSARRARLNREAAIEGASTGLAKARAELAAAKAEGPKSGESDEAYIERIKVMTQQVNALAEANKKGAKAKDTAGIAQRKLAREMETASDKADKLLGIMDRYTEDTPVKRLERLQDEAKKAKRAIDDLIGEKVEGYGGAFTQADADAKKAEIDASVERQARQPVVDMIKAGREQLVILDLLARGQGDLAEFTRRRLDLEKQVADVTDDDLDRIRGQIAEEHRLNDVLYERSQIIENNAQFLGTVRDAGRDAIRAFLGGDFKGGIKDFAKKVKNAFLDAKANEIAIKLFGDPEKKYRDQMTRGLNDSAGKLTGSAGALETAGDKLSAAANDLSNAAATEANRPITTADGTIAPALLASQAGGLLGDLAQAVEGLSSAGGGGPSFVDENGDIVVTGSRRKTTPITMPGGIDSVLSDLFGSLMGGTGGGGLGSIMNGIMGGMSGIAGGGGIEGFLQGAMSAASAANPIVGLVAGASAMITSLFTKKKLGPAGLFGILPTLLFGKKPKAKTGMATISDLSGGFTTSGRTGSYREEASGMARSVISSLQNILDQLGGVMGSFAVSIGRRKDKYVVDISGTGQTKGPGTPSFESEAEAIRYAIMDAIRDGAIAGIKESTQRLLQAGEDLDAALEKALKFEDVFRRLKQIKDPIGAALDDLNREFRSLIQIFTEAQASAAEWDQLQELYDYERAEAIKNATKNAVAVLDDFIQSITSGPESPLSKRTVYENAKKEVDKFRADILAGKPVDQDALVTALQNYQDASAAMNGSREQFYQDFADLLSLAQAAKANVPAPDSAALPPNPFDVLAPIASQHLTEAQRQTAIMQAMLAWLNGGTPPPSTVDALPSSVSSGGSSSGGSISLPGYYFTARV